MLLLLIRQKHTWELHVNFDLPVECLRCNASVHADFNWCRRHLYCICIVCVSKYLECKRDARWDIGAVCCTFGLPRVKHLRLRVLGGRSSSSSWDIIIIIYLSINILVEVQMWISNLWDVNMFHRQETCNWLGTRLTPRCRVTQTDFTLDF